MKRALLIVTLAVVTLLNLGAGPAAGAWTQATAHRAAGAPMAVKSFGYCGGATGTPC